MSEESKEKSAPNQTVGGTQIVYLHLSDIFKTKPKSLNKKTIINEIKTHIGLKKGKMYIIKLNGSYCKYFRIKENTFSQEDFKDGGTFDDKGFLNLIPGTATPTVTNEANDGEVKANDGEVKAEQQEQEQQEQEQQNPENTPKDKNLLVLLDEDGEAEEEEQEEATEDKNLLVLLKSKEGNDDVVSKVEAKTTLCQDTNTLDKVEKKWIKQVLERGGFNNYNESNGAVKDELDSQFKGLCHEQMKQINVKEQDDKTTEGDQKSKNTDDFSSLNIPEEKKDAVLLFLKSRKFKIWFEENKESLKDNKESVGELLMTSNDDKGVINKYNEELPQNSKKTIWFNWTNPPWPTIKEIIIDYVIKKAKE